MAGMFQSISLNGNSNSRRPLLRLPSRSTLLFLGLSLMWYSCSFLSASTSKALLSGRKNKAHPLSYDGMSLSGNGTSTIHDTATQVTSTAYKTPPLFPYPVSLTALQFAFVFTFSYTLCSPTIARYLYQWMGRPPPRDPDTGRARGLMSTLIVLDGAKLREMMGLSMFSVTGHAMTSAAIQLVPVSTVHTIKALSPLFTVLSYVFILHLSYPLKTYISLAPLTLGVILACSGLSSIEGSKAWIGVLLSVGSTVVFVAQNLWSKKLLGHALSGAAPATGSGGTSIKLDKLNLLLWSSGVSFLFMIPLVVYSDVPKLRIHGGQSNFNANGLSGDLRNGTVSNPLQSLLPRGASVPAPSTTLRTIELLISNGSVHFAQSLLAFSILGLTSPVTYSIASLFKRVFVICFAIIWFGQTVSGVQWMGIVLTFVGLYLYNDSKQKPSSGDGKGFSLSQSMASREDEAAEELGMEKSSRRRVGLLPTSASTAPAQKPLASGGGPIWKGMSSSLMAGANGNGHYGLNGSAGAEVKNGPKRD